MAESELMEPPRIPQHEKFYCLECSRLTNHTVHAAHSYTVDHDAKGLVSTYYAWKIVECEGCNFVHAVRESVFSEDMDYDYDENGETINVTRPNLEYFPAYADTQIPDWLYEIEDDFVESYKEMVKAISNESLVLAVLGARAIMDQLMIIKIGDCGTFQAKVNAFAREGFITPAMKQALEKVLDAGHAAMHRGHIPALRTIEHIIKIIDVVLRSTLLGSQWAAELDQLTPKRKSRGGNPQ